MTRIRFSSIAPIVAGDYRMRLPRSLAAALYRTPQQFSPCTTAPGTAKFMDSSEFRPKRILILTKVTRYEFEKRVNSHLQEKQLEASLRRRGSDYNRLLTKHQQHHAYVKTIQSELDRAGIESRLVQRWEYDESVINWADCVMTAGGDGTFLMAASKIKTREKPVIGINTDPQGSEGYMCLMRKLPKEHFRSALDRLLRGDFHWLFRQRIRISVTGDEGISDAIELHDQQLNRKPSTTRWTDNPRHPGEPEGSVDHHEYPFSPHLTKSKNGTDRVVADLPVLALNEVYIGESLSSRVSYYEIQVDNGHMVKQKSSGITICTGTGSTSWYFNINKLTDQCVVDLLRIIKDRCQVDVPDDGRTVSDLCTMFNQQLIFDADLPRLAFSVRDPVFNATFPPTAPRGFADKIIVKSRGYDAHLVVDGGVSYRFNDGSEAVLQVNEEDALRTVVFR